MVSLNHYGLVLTVSGGENRGVCVPLGIVFLVQLLNNIKRLRVYESLKQTEKH